MKYLFGPVPSRRLGLSLGVDLIPPKTCSYDCLYCQIGKTTCKAIEPSAYVPVEAVIAELDETLAKVQPDYVTFSGSGEPTLHVGLGRLIAYVKERTAAKVAVLTNGSLLYRPEVRERLLKADMVMPTLSTVREETYRAIHQPHDKLNVASLLSGLKSLRKTFRGQLFIEVMLLAGFNDRDEEIEALRQGVLEIAPDRVQLNTVVRPPANAKAIPLDRKKLEYIKRVFGECAEIIATAPVKEKQHFQGTLSAAVLEMARRRPVTVEDVAGALDAPLSEVDKTVKALVHNGELRLQTHIGKDYYTG
ncbi:MAG: radical SAM protein [Deltaproteobacteria bacterium]|nr:radical SAM protein [Deltaproteobacteria bacterium]